MFLSFFSENYIAIIAVSLIVIFFVSLLLVFLIRKHKGKKDEYLQHLKQSREVLSIKNSNVLKNYLNRLQSISNTNKSYLELYETLSKRFLEINDTDKTNMLTRCTGLEDRFTNEAKISKGLLEQYNQFLDDVAKFDIKVNELQKDFEKEFKEADDLRIRKITLAEKYQKITQDIEKYNTSIALCKKELKNYLSDAQMYFDLYDDNQKDAKYNEAKRNLDSIDEMLVNVYGNVERIASYCHYVDTIIPEQLNELKEKNDRLEKDGYVVAFTRVNEFINNTNEVLEDVKKQFKLLCFGDFEDIEKEIQEKLAEINRCLDDEVKAKDELDERYAMVAKKIKTTESDFITTKRQYATMIEYYILDDTVKDRFKEFQKRSTTLSGMKREYDSYIFVGDKHPASYLLKKVEEMDDVANEVIDDINYFSNYFYDLKNYVEETYNSIYSLSVLLVKALGNILKNNSRMLYDLYVGKVNDLLLQLEEQKAILEKAPIDIAKIRLEFNDIALKANELESTINNNLENYLMVEKCIIFANPLRSSFKEVDRMLNEVEEKFRQNELKEAQDMINDVLNNYHPAAFEAFRG